MVRKAVDAASGLALALRHKFASTLHTWETAAHVVTACPSKTELQLLTIIIHMRFLRFGIRTQVAVQSYPWNDQNTGYRATSQQHTVSYAPHFVPCPNCKLAP